jgi:hypothetical protein
MPKEKKEETTEEADVEIEGLDDDEEEEATDAGDEDW